jgi:dCMP deaminase
MTLTPQDVQFLELARQWSTWSKDPSTKTGAVLVRDDSVLGSGFNEFPWKMRDDPALYADREQKYSRIVHCEVNALIAAARSIDGATLYTWPFMSCDRCVVQMIQAGVVRFVAPAAAPDAATRWEPVFVKTRAYIAEAGLDLVEVLDYCP